MNDSCHISTICTIRACYLHELEHALRQINPSKIRFIRYIFIDEGLAPKLKTFTYEQSAVAWGSWWPSRTILDLLSLEVITLRFKRQGEPPSSIACGEHFRRINIGHAPGDDHFLRDYMDAVAANNTGVIWRSLFTLMLRPCRTYNSLEISELPWSLRRCGSWKDFGLSGGPGLWKEEVQVTMSLCGLAISEYLCT